MVCVPHIERGVAIFHQFGAFFPVMIDCYEEGTDTAFLFFNVNVTFYQMSGGFFTQI